MQSSILFGEALLSRIRRPILVRGGGHHCIFLLPIKKNSKPPGFTTPAPSVSNLENEGSLYGTSLSQCYGCMEDRPPIYRTYFHFAGNAWASHTKLGSLSLLMSTVYKFGFDLTSPEQHSIIFRLVEDPNQPSTISLYL